MNQGDVCLAQFPFTDASSTRLRPILIVSSADQNKGEDVIAVPISSRPEEDDPFSYHLGDDYERAGLKKESAVKWNKPATIARCVITRRIGTMPESDLAVIIRNLISVFDQN